MPRGVIPHVGSTTVTSLYACSASDRWSLRIKQPDYNKVFIKALPYSVILKATQHISGSWPMYQVALRFIHPSNSAEDFFAKCSASETRLDALIKVGLKVNDLVLEGCFGVCENHSEKRAKMNNDTSMGYMYELSQETLNEIARRCEANGNDYRLLADGLGFSADCCNTHTFMELIKKWIEEFPEATVARLHFEVAQLGYDDVRNCLEAIPLVGISECNPSVPQELNGRYTRFHQKELLKLAEDLGEQAETINAMEEYQKRLLRKKNQSGNIHDLLKLMKKISFLEEIANEFAQKLADGSFVHKSAGGVTFAQAAYLATFAPNNKLMRTELKKANFKEWALELWQDKPSLNLFQYYELLRRRVFNIDLLMIFEFPEYFQKILPFRSFDPQLELLNRSLKSNAAEVDKVASRVLVDNDQCVICMDKPREVMLLPCAHLNFCIECVNSLHAKTCPSCMQEFKRVVKPIKS